MSVILTYKGVSYPLANGQPGNLTMPPSSMVPAQTMLPAINLQPDSHSSPA